MVYSRVNSLTFRYVFPKKRVNSDQGFPVFIKADFFFLVENVKGAVWTVDEVEYQKRRSQKITGYVCDSFVKPVSHSQHRK